MSAFSLIAPAAFLIACCLAFSAHAADEPNVSPNLKYYYPVPKADPPQVIEADMIVYGATPGGIGAAVQMQRLGKKAVIVEFGKHVGGLSSGGLSATDVGNKGAIGGMALEFYSRLGKISGFKPSDAETKFTEMLKEAGVTVHFEHRMASVKKDGNRIVEIEFENGNKARGKMFVDATYEGDLFAKAGVSYHVGREANSVYGETYNGVQMPDRPGFNTHNFLYPTDPYKVEGDPKSGLLWGISTADMGKQGEGDKRVQAYNFRMFLTNAEDRIPFPKPNDYDASRYELMLRYLLKRPELKWKFDYPEGPFQLKNGDCNNAGGFSTDLIGGSDLWPEADYATREKIFQDHVNYQLGMMWFMSHEERVPEVWRTRVKGFGLPQGEFPETGGWTHQLYIREGRRMISDLVMTEKHCRGMEVIEDSVGLASYGMDSHSCQRVIIDGVVRNEGCVEKHTPKPYPVSYRSIVPKESECANLLVPVCLSSSHMAYGSIRMEPVFMILGQSAGFAAALAIDGNVSVQKVDYAALRPKLLEAKQFLEFTGEVKKKEK